MYDLVVIGSPSFDRVIRGSTPENGRLLSGPVMYSIRSASQLNLENTAIIGSLCPLYFSRFLSSLGSIGNPEYVMIESMDTGGFEVAYNGGPEASFLSILGTPKSIGIRDIPDEFLSSRVIILSPLLQEIGAELIEWLCNSSDASIFLDPQLRSLGSNMELTTVDELQVIEKTRSYLDYIKPNEQEAYLITGERDMFLAAELLVDSLAENCIITLGDKGCIIYDGNEFKMLPSYSGQKKDTLGAGAVFLTGFAAALLDNHNVVSCGSLGAALASQKIEYYGLEFKLNRSNAEQRAKQIMSHIQTR